MWDFKLKRTRILVMLSFIWMIYPAFYYAAHMNYFIPPVKWFSWGDFIFYNLPLIFFWSIPLIRFGIRWVKEGK